MLGQLIRRFAQDDLDGKFKSNLLKKNIWQRIKRKKKSYYI